MDRECKVRNEKDPYLREIWVMGYDNIIEDHVSNEFLNKSNSDKYIKKIPMFSLTQEPFTIKTAILYIDRTKHSWISKADGSCERFRVN